MWPVAIFLMLVVGFYWFAFMGTIWFCFNGLMALWAGHFIRASIWASLGVGMLFWWQGTEVIPHPWDVEAWLRGSAVIVGIGALGTFVRYHRKRQAMVSVPTMPTWTPPKTPANDNQLVMFSLRVKETSTERV
jgi:hypothetical protein